MTNNQMWVKKLVWFWNYSQQLQKSVKVGNIAVVAFVDYLGLRHYHRLAVLKAVSLMLETRLSVVNYTLDCSMVLVIAMMRSIVCWM